MLERWTYTSAINQGDWNTLKVTADGSTLKFYINGVYVWSGTDSSLDSGLVGLVMYPGIIPAGDKFYVDWAKLSTTVAAAEGDLEPAPGIEAPGGD
jgi:hypothetical protein